LAGNQSKLLKINILFKNAKKNTKTDFVENLSGHPQLSYKNRIDSRTEDARLQTKSNLVHILFVNIDFTVLLNTAKNTRDPIAMRVRAVYLSSTRDPFA